MTTHSGAAAKKLRIVAWLTIAAAIILAVAGVVTWVAVTSNLKAQDITVASDSTMLPGHEVAGPFTAYAQAQIIEHHALKATGGKTYAQLGQDDPNRQTAMEASFLRASLFTAVVSYGVATLAFGLGIIFALLGWALLVIAQPLRQRGMVVPEHAAAG